MLRRLRLLLALLLLASHALHAQHNAARLSLYYGIAEGNYLIGDLKGAAKGIDEMLELDPDYLPALTLQARVKLDQGEALAALAAAERAAQLAPAAHEQQLLKALVLGNLKRHAEAIVLIEQVIASAEPGGDDARAAQQLLGLLRMAEGNWDAAAQAFNQLYLAAPASDNNGRQLAAEAYIEKARSALREGKNADAVQALNQAMAMYEGQSGQESLRQRTAVRMLRARTLTQIGQLDAAIADLQVISGQQPDNLEALVTLASLYASAQRWESLQGLITPLAAEPQLQDIALYLEGRVSLAQDRAGTARAKFEAAFQQLSDGPSQLRAALHFYRGWCLEKLARHDEANAEIHTALEAGFRPENADEAMLAARTRLRLKQPEQAIQLLEAITLNGLTPAAEAWILLGRAHLAKHASSLALSAFTQALTIDAEQTEALALRGALLRELGDLQGAAADTARALRLTPDDAALSYTLGLIRLQQGELQSAAQQLGLAAQQLRDNAGIQLLHALLAYCVDTPSAARSTLNHYLSLVPIAPNESAYFLEYALNAGEDPAGAIQTLQQHDSAQRSVFFKQFIHYITGDLDRKALLDKAGIAATPEIAQQQIAEAAFWMAQHKRARGHINEFRELLTLATQIANPDIPEFQFAHWQLRQP
jgi:tetratricopeptide (TPR) repeat protein